MKWPHERSAYDVLGVNQASTTESIVATYKRLIVNVHPDRDDSKEALIEFKRIRDAFEILSDPIRRKEYDQTLNANASSVRFSLSVGRSGWRQTREQIMLRRADPRQSEPMTDTQFEIICDIQRIQGFGVGRIRWDLVFEEHTDVAENKGNASILLSYLLDVSALRRKSGHHWEQLSELGVTTLEEIRELNPILREPPFNVRRTDGQRQRLEDRQKQNIDPDMAAYEHYQQISIETNINSQIEIIVQDVATLFELQFERIRTVAYDVDTFTKIRPLLAIFNGNFQMLVGAAAFSDLLGQIVVTFNYGCISNRKLEVAKNILSTCMCRNSMRDKQQYKRFSQLETGFQVAELFSTWSKDDGLFGGDFRNGAIYLPLQHLVNVSSIVTQELAIHDQYTQTMLIVIRLLLEADGITHSKEEYFANQKRHYDKQRESIVQFLKASNMH
jgi:hypothetical protein